MSQRQPQQEEQNEEKDKTRVYRLLIGGINGGISRLWDLQTWTRIGGK